MLQTLRKSASGIIAKILMGLLIVSFGVWGIADVFRGFGSQTLATIGDTEITVPEFRQLYQERVQQISQQIKRGLTPDQARAIGVPDQLLNERLAEAALDDVAKTMGLAISDEEIVRRVHSNPAFFGPSGAFDPNYFNQILRSNNFTEARFVEAERRLALRQQLIQSLGGGIELPQVMKDAAARFESEERAVNYTVLSPTSVTVPEPTEEQLRSFFEARKVAFRAPEFRKIDVLALTPQSLASSEQIPDAEVEAAYQNNLASFGTPEKRVVQQIVFANAEEANAAAERIKAGTSFADIAAERKLEAKDIDLGDVTRADIFDKAIADAAFALAPDSTSGVIAGRFGPVIVHVGAVTPGTTKPLSEVAGELRTQLQTQAARAALHSTFDKVEDERAGGARLNEIAGKFGLTVRTVDVDAQGRTADGSVTDIPGRSDVLAGAFGSDVGVENDVVQLPQDGGYVWYDVVSIAPPRDRTFEEARAQVLDRWKQDETAQALDARVEELKKQIEAGTPFDQVVTGAGLEMRTANGLRRSRTNEGLAQEALAAVFETPANGVSSAQIGGGDSRVLFQLVRIATPSGNTVNDKLLADIRQSMENDLMTEYLVQLQNDLGARINRAALDQIVGGGESVN